MTTTTLPITIACPDWCVRAPEEHVADIWEMGGNCVHTTGRSHINDTDGFQQPLEPTRYHQPIEIMLSSSTDPHEGRETESPILFIDERPPD